MDITWTPAFQFERSPNMKLHLKSMIARLVIIIRHPRENDNITVVFFPGIQLATCKKGKFVFASKNQAPNLSLQLQQLCEKYIKFIEIYPHAGMVTQSSNEIPEADGPVITLLSSHISGQSD